MTEILKNNTILALIVLIAITILAVFLLIKLAKKVGLEKVRHIVYQGFDIAEREFQKGENTQKFDFVVSLAREAIPAPFNIFITDKNLRKVIQLWFDISKDFLDDGKFNGGVDHEDN